MTKNRGRGGRRSSTQQEEQQPALLESPAAQNSSAGLPAEAPFPIVGVGASAGGLEAFSQLLEALPEDTRAAFVLVQHLDPARESMLVEILGRAARLSVLNAEDGQYVEPGQVYVAPPGMTITISQNRLQLEPAAPEIRRLSMPIDTFLRSLARDQRNRAVGVILSGTGTDGTLGLHDVKEHGGLALVQDVKTARFAGMPQSAIAHVAVDAVLPPGEIAQMIARLAQHPYVIADGEEALAEAPAPSTTQNGLGHILRLLRSAYGVDFAAYKVSTILRRTVRRMALLGLDELDGYARYCEGHSQELSALYHDLLIKVTAFFRDPESFESLKETVLPALFQERAPETPLRVWVPGCATGEEAYSLAIMLLEWLNDQQISPPPIQIFATDIDEVALATARTGTYIENIALDVSPQRLERFFTRVDHTYKIANSVRELCTFARHDLLRDPPFSNLDLVSCRNLLMYMDSGAQQRVIPNFHYALRPTGFLMLGMAETIGASTRLFDLVDSKHRIYAKQPGIAHPTMAIPGLGGRREPNQGAVLGAGMSPSTRQTVRRDSEEAEMYRDADRALLGHYAPPGVLVNEHLDILQFRGDTGHFLLSSPGRASLNLFKMAREGLLAEVRAAVEEARQTGGAAVRENVSVSYEDETLDVTVRVIPVRPHGGTEPFFLVAFEDHPSGMPRPRRRRRADAAGRQGDDRRVQQLRQELEVTKEYLETAIGERDVANEELKSAYEEVLSANEELQSTNEELETAKEELQSTNEELTTSNEELGRRYQELTSRTDDLYNLFDSGYLPVVQLDDDLRIRALSNVAQEVLNIIPTDLGRPITDLRLNIQVPDLDQLLRRVVSAGEAIEREVQDLNELWYLLRLRPYRTEEGKITGAVLSIINIESIKDVERLKQQVEHQQRAQQQALQEALQYVEDVIATLPDPFLILDETLQVLDANGAFYGAFQVLPADTVGGHMSELGNGQWDIPELRVRLEKVLEEDQPFRDLEITHDFPAIGRRTLLLSACRVRRDHLPELRSRVLLAMRDITQRKQMEEALRRSEERLRKVLSTDALGVIFLDEETGIFLDANDTFLRLTGYSRREVEAGEQDWQKLTPPEYMDESRRQLEYLRDTGRIGPHEKEYLGKDGSRKMMLFSGASLGDGTLVIFCIDITEREQLRQASQRKDEFLATLSHELRNPLAVISTAVELLRRDRGDPAAQEEALSFLEHQLGFMNRLMDALLDVSRITRGRIKLHQADMDLRQVVEWGIRAMGSEIEGRDQDLQVSLPDHGVWVHADSARLEQVVVNLLSNATKYSPPGSSIGLDVSEEGGEAVMRVRDTGQGIDPGVLPRIFELFWQAKQPLDRAQSGLGLGLTLVKSLVEMHGGTVTAASEGLGRGSEFIVRLPSVPAPASPPAESPAEPEGTATTPLRVLFVDDRLETVAIFGRLLEKLGHQVRTAHDGPSALEAARQFQPEVALLDIGLPGMDGYELARRLRQEPSLQNIAIIAFTGYGQESDLRLSREAGFDHHLVKPLDIDVLERIFAEVREAGRQER